MSRALRNLFVNVACLLGAAEGLWAGGDDLSVAPPSQSPIFEEWAAASAPLIEPLIAVEGIEKSQTEDAALESALFQGRPEYIRERIEDFVVQHPHSRWRAILEVNLGLYRYRDGYFTRAMDHFERSYQLAKGNPGGASRRIAGMAAAQLSRSYARLGRMEDLWPLLDEAMPQDVDGSARQTLEQSREALNTMISQPGIAFKCGPLALARIREELGIEPVFHPIIEEAKSTWRGFSLSEVEEMAESMGMDYVVAKASGDISNIPVPSVIHWKQNHYAAILREVSDGKYLVRDLTFGFDGLIDLAAIREEASGFFLIDRKALGDGWMKVSQDDAWQVYGRGLAATLLPNAVSRLYDVWCQNLGACAGMASYGFSSMMASLGIVDTPIGYVPPVGTEINFTVHYNQRETLQPSGSIVFGNLGRQWGHNWSSWVETGTLSATVALRDGGGETFVRTTGTSPFGISNRSMSTLTMTGSTSYRRDLPDGSSEVYSTAQSLGAGLYRLFLSEIVDSSGNSTHLSYDGSFRLTEISDAIGQETTLFYENASFPFQVTRVQDPFGRVAAFGYNLSGQLVSITDVIGIVSSFTYGGGSFVDSLTTPYGTTRFAFSATGSGSALKRTLTAVDPMGRTEKIEQVAQIGTVTIPANEVPPTSITVSGSNVSFLSSTSNYDYRNSFYWDKKAFAEGETDRTKAINYHWLHTPAGLTSPFLEAVKKPLESWVYFNYQNQTSGYFEPSGTFVGKPTKTARVVNVVSGTKYTALTQTSFNTLGLPIKLIDPIGRETKLTYAANNIDLIKVEQKNASGGYDILMSSTYNTKHLPLSVTGPDGKTSSMTWNTRGQILSSTNALSETTSYDYDGDGYLQSIDPPLTGTSDLITLTYDAVGRVATRTQWGYTRAYVYDALDRVTRVTYPDATTEEVVYEAMHPRWLKDRLGRWTRRDVNAVQQVIGVLDPASRYTAYEWCKCGSLAAIIDAMGQKTSWGLDLQGRQTSKTYADGRSEIYAYNPYSGWLETKTDAAGQQVKAEYALDGRGIATRYVNEAVATPDVTLAWDSKYPRLVNMVDGTGTTSYTYQSSGTNGAGKIATIDGSLSSDTIGVLYDDLGRVASRAIGATTEGYTYDALGRVTAIANPLDTFSVAYDPIKGVPVSLAGGNGLTIANDHYDAAGDYRLRETIYTWTGTGELAEFGYQYDAGGRITRWDQKIGAGDPRRIVPSYDMVSQLTGASTSNPVTNTLVGSEAFRYDRIGNRLGAQKGSDVTQATFNRVNQITSQAAGGEAVIRGLLDEPGTVTIGGKTVRTDAQNKFSLTVPVTTGTNQFSVVSSDINGNSTTNTATFTVAASGSTSFTYDLNGNTIDDGQRTYEWDGAGRVVAINYTGTNTRTEFSYDGMSRIVRINELAGGVSTSDSRFVWDGMSIAERRAADGVTVQKRYFAAGFQYSGTSGPENYFYVKDHLGSIRAIVDSGGVERGRWNYDLWGRRGLNQVLSGAVESDFGYTGHLEHSVSGLTIAPFRFYNSALGRWISRDPIGENGGINLYGYVANEPVNQSDPLGLFESPGWMRTTIPGQVSWDNALTSFENGNVGTGIGFLGAMLVEQVVFVKTLGQGSGLMKGAGTAMCPVSSALQKTTLAEGDAILAAIKDGKIIAESGDLLLSHKDFVARKLAGVIPDGAEIVTIGKHEGEIFAQLSAEIYNGARPASPAAQAAARAVFQ